MFYDYQGNISLTSLTDVITTFYYSTAIPIKFSDKNNTITIIQPVKNNSKLCDEQVNSLNVNKVRTTIIEKNLRNQIYYYTKSTHESYLTIGLWNKAIYQGMLIAGPILLNPITKADEKRVLVNEKNNKNYNEYINTLPVITLNQWLAMGRLLERLCNDNYSNSKLSTFKLNSKPEEIKKIDFKEKMNDVVQNYMIDEKDLFMTLLSGDNDKISECYTKILQYPLPIMCKNDAIRSYKNNFIYACTRVLQKAIELGIKNTDVFQMCIDYIADVEEKDTIDDITVLFREMFQEFSIIIKYHNQNNLSPVVLSTIMYIKNHLTENISLEAIAKETHYTAKYISAIFVKEVGVTLVDYINNNKVEEAKKMLMHTNYTVSEIALQLGFCNQSYFSKVFKKFEGITPKKYKSKNYNEAEKPR